MKWKFAVYHHPAYSSAPSRDNKDIREHWVPLFEQHQLDLVCEADGHNIKRTVPIRNGKRDPTGVVYIGEGGLGVPQRQPAGLQ